ncbi:MAG: alpha/beta hydrolase-fold protein [Saprospiraceae bacterium]|nr:alpha/beta hydrolase [Lewinella sp.]
MNRTLLVAGCICYSAFSLFAQPQSDLAYHYPIHFSSYEKGEGPVIVIDGAHNNYHTYEGGFRPFALLLEEDGYRVQSGKEKFSNDYLKQCNILVIANPLSEDDTHGWIKPNPPAFSSDEVAALKSWVSEGGSLLLIADHMPFPGAASNIAEAFGFHFSNGFAMADQQQFPPSNFDRSSGTLHENAITEGSSADERIDHIASFTGSAFQSPEGAMPILSFGKDHRSLEPDTAWRFHPDTPAVPLEGWQQGAALNFGKGRIVVYGEAAMLTAQIAQSRQGPFKIGFNHPQADQNAQLVLNTIHWLDHAISLQAGKKTKSLLSVEQISLPSEFLEEWRELYVHLPASYDTTSRDYPLLVVLDADYRFSVTFGIIDYMSYWQGLPEMILLGIPNIDREGRRQNLLPTAYGGEADQFLLFLREEVLPYIEEHYRVSSQRVLIGHSHAGVFTAYTLLTQPDLFQGYIAADPSLEGLIPLEKEQLAKSYPGKKLYISSSDVGSGLAPEIVRSHLDGIRGFQEYLEQMSPRGLAWKFSHIADDHGNAYMQSASEGLRFVFK